MAKQWYWTKPLYLTLRGCCSKHLKLLDEPLHYIQHAYNWVKNSSTNTSFLDVCFGYFPKSYLDFILEKDVAINGHCDIDKVCMFIERTQLIHQQVQEQLEKVKASTRRISLLILIFGNQRDFGVQELPIWEVWLGDHVLRGKSAQILIFLELVETRTNG